MRNWVAKTAAPEQADLRGRKEKKNGEGRLGRKRAKQIQFGSGIISTDLQKSSTASILKMATILLTPKPFTISTDSVPLWGIRSSWKTTLPLLCHGDLCGFLQTPPAHRFQSSTFFVKLWLWWWWWKHLYTYTLPSSLLTILLWSSRIMRLESKSLQGISKWLFQN